MREWMTSEMLAWRLCGSLGVPTIWEMASAVLSCQGPSGLGVLTLRVHPRSRVTQSSLSRVTSCWLHLD